MIVCLQETKADMDKITKKKYYQMVPDGYEQYWNSSEDKKGYSGVAILTRIKPIQVLFGIQIAKHDQEGRVLTAEFNSFYLVCVYVPNSGEGLKRLDYRIKEWDKDFTKYLKALEKRKLVVLAGDLNVAHFEIDIYDPNGMHKICSYTP